jgi:hypothetical protein
MAAFAKSCGASKYFYVATNAFSRGRLHGPAQGGASSFLLTAGWGIERGHDL